MDDAPRFLADVMLGKLTRWLRLLGFDVAYDPAGDDDGLLARAHAEGRVLLTRDVELARRAGASGFLVTDRDPDRQLDEVVRGLALSVRPEQVLARCSVCNAPLDAARPDEVAGRVPAGVLVRHATFSACTVCGRVYWAGSHHARVRARARAFEASNGPDP